MQKLTDEHISRLKGFSGGLSENGLRAAMITKPENMRYISGYTGEGCIFVQDGEGFIITDFRYIEQAQRQCGFMKVERTVAPQTAADIINGLIGGKNITKVAFESDKVSYDSYLALKDKLAGVELVKMPGVLPELRRVKDQGEIDKIVEASRIACEAFTKLLDVIRPGMTEREVQRTLEWNMLELGSEEPAFKTIACSGLNGSLPHAIPSDHKIEKGELLTIDFGAQVDGYKTDITRTVAIGEISRELRDIYDTVLKAQLLALDGIGPGKPCFDIDKLARDFIDLKYPGAFGHSLGHGVGLNIHETPNLSVRATGELKPGHVVTVEPGVYVPGVGGCRIEDTVIITPTGFINPITIPKELITL